ncbi:MAG: hypothetical protein JW867_04100 [Candidatus Omnitrophica bacterium]|nr:hypothetical protein [Candidatus Omnitrophota bacterium]
MLKKIKFEDKLIAVILPHDFYKEGVEFFTPKEFSQQLGYMNYPAGHRIEPHIHKLLIREIKYTQEAILVKSGKVKVDFYSESKQYISSEVLVSGDVLLLASGGHGFIFLEKSELIEIKQGPYISLKVDKEKFGKTDE